MVLFQVFWFAYLAVILLASSIWKDVLWGANSWGFISQTAAFLIFLIVVAAYSWKRFSGQEKSLDTRGGQDSTGKSGDDTTTTGTGKKRQPNRESIIFILFSAVILAVMRNNHRFWGEAATYPHALLSADPTALSSPASWAINWVFFKFMNSVFVLDPAESSAIVGFLSGVVFVLIALATARRIEKISGADGSITSPLLILLNGYIVVFFTLGKAPLATLFVLMFVYSSIVFIEDKGSILHVTLFYLLSLLSQPGTIFITIPFVYLLYLAFVKGKNGTNRGTSDSAILAMLIAIGALLITNLLKTSKPGVIIANLTLRSLRNTFSNEVTDGSLWMNALNELLIIGPASVASLILIFKRKKQDGKTESEKLKTRMDGFLRLSAVSGLILMPFSAWKLEGGINWHIMASTGPVLAVFTLWALVRNFPGKYRRTVYLLALIGAFQTLPWLVVNFSEKAAGERLKSLPLAPGRAETILGRNYLEKGKREEALNLLTSAVEKNPRNDTAYYLLGLIHMDQDKHSDAISDFTNALRIDSTNVEYRFLLADAFIEKRWFDDAIAELEPLVNRYPDSARFWQRLGYAYNHSGRYKKAVAAYRKALELVPERRDYKENLASALINRGAELQTAKEMNKARSCYLQAIKIVPTAWPAYNNLIAIEIEEGNIETAEEMLKEVLKVNPYGPELNLNMANLRERKGEIEKAIEYFEKASRLNPMIPGVDEHIDSLKTMLKKKVEK